MAERRMFAKSIVMSDDFLDLPMSARCLYFTLGMFADDDGFVNNPRAIMRQVGATQDDMKILLTKKYVIAFDSGVIVIRHWRIHNYIQSDRYHETVCQEEKSMLSYSENGKVYEQIVETPTMDTRCIQDVSKMDTEVRLGKGSIGEDSQGDIYSADIQEIVAYLNEMTGQHYKPSSDYIIRLIKARMNDKFTVEDFKTVIYKKTKQWKSDPSMVRYLRPQTLFGTKFEAYLNEVEVRSKEEQFSDVLRDFVEGEKK